MRTKRRRVLERLEQRRLLAGDVCLADAPLESLAGTVTPQESLDVAPEVLPLTPLIANAPRSFPMTLPVIDRYQPMLWGGWDLVEESDGHVAAVRSNRVGGLDEPQATVYLFERGESGDLVLAGELELDFYPRNLFLEESMLVIVGHHIPGRPNARTQDDWVYLRTDSLDQQLNEDIVKTTVLTVSTDDLSDRSRVSIDGAAVSVAKNDARLFVSTLKVPVIQPAIYPPPPLVYDVNVFDIGGNELKSVAHGELLAPVTENRIVGDDILLPNLRFPGDVAGSVVEPGVVQLPDRFSSAELIRYRIRDGQIERVASVDLELSVVTGFEVAPDGMTAVVFGNGFERTDSSSTSSDQIWSPQRFDVVLIDLSEDQPKLFQSIELRLASDYLSDVEIGERAVVIADGPASLLVVDTNQEIDIDPQGRVSRIALPNSAESNAVHVSSLTEISAGTFLLTRALRETASVSTTVNDALEFRPSTRHEVLTLSLGEMSVVADATVDASHLAVTSPGSSVPQLIQLTTILLPDRSKQLAVGTVDESGQFETSGLIDLAGALELDVDGRRLLVREHNRLVEYPWLDLESPSEIPLGTPPPPPVAVDDTFERNADSRDRYLDVLANDQYELNHTVDRPRIVELIGAPEGIEIVPGGNVLRFTDEILAGAFPDEGGSFTFEYTIKQGQETSSAAISLTLFRFSDRQVRAAVERIVDQAAEDTGVESSQVFVGTQRHYTAYTMPDKFTDEIANPLAGQYGVLVDVVVGDELYRYVANFDDDVERVSSRTLEVVMGLRLQAVDATGNELNVVRPGDEFFLQVTAEDLREFGLGVFGVAFDLPLPSNKLELTGDIELLGSFDDFGNPITETGIDEFTALEVLIDHPGDRPQPVVRFGVRALAGGEVRLQLDPAESIRSELLIRGRDDLVSPSEVDFGGLTLSIEGIEPTDTDANGEVTPTDALRVINFLGVYGSVRVEEFAGLAAALEAEEGDGRIDVEAVRRLDTSGDGVVTARDALLVINDLAVRFFARGEAEPIGLTSPVDLLGDDDEDEESWTLGL